MKELVPLPFTLNPESLAEWLETLADLPAAKAASQISQILDSLDNSKLDNAIFYPILIQLTPPILFLSTQLAELSSQGSTPELRYKSIKVGKLGLHLLKHLAISFCHLATSRGLTDTQAYQACFHALQIFGYCLRNYALIHDIPSKSIWKNTAILYQYALHNQILNQHHTSKLQEFKQQNSIAAILKRNLLFSILEPNRHDTVEIIELFRICNQHSGLLEINADQGNQFCYFWDLKGTHPGTSKSGFKLSNPNFMVINPQNFADELQSGKLQTSLPPSSQTKIALELCRYKLIFSALNFGHTTLSQFLVGFTDVCNYLREFNKITQIQAMGKPAEEINIPALDLSLIPMESTKKTSTTTQAIVKLEHPSQTINLFRSNSKMFVIAEKIGIICEVDDMAVLYREQLPPTLTVVRQKISHPANNTTLVLLEYLYGSFTVLDFTDTNGTNCQVLTIGETGSHPEAILAAGKYTVDQKIPLRNGKIMHLLACSEFNSHYCRFRIQFDS